MNDFPELFFLFLSSLIAATLFPAGSEAALLAICAKVDVAVWILLFVASVGNVLGACISYGLGAYMLHYQDRKWFPMKQDKVEKYKKFYEKWGVWSLLLAWVPIIGDPLTFLAGVFKAARLPFLIMVSIGKVGRYALLLAMV